MDLLTTVPDDKFTRTLVLLALEIPRLSGFEILKRLQFDDRLCRTRVIILTSSTDRPVIDRRLQAWSVRMHSHPSDIRGTGRHSQSGGRLLDRSQRHALRRSLDLSRVAVTDSSGVVLHKGA